MRKSKSKSFNFLYPTTYEQNQEQLTRLNSEILEASKQRNYKLAKKLQQEYNYCLQVDNYFKEQKQNKEKDNESLRLKNARLREEELLRQRMTNKMKNILSQYEQRLQILEEKHQENLNQIEDRFSSPRYAAYRPSPGLHQMLKEESYYANQRDFDSAEQYRDMIAQKAHSEIIDYETNTELSISSAIESENRRYEIEKKGFHARLENEKTKLKKETEKELLLIKHRYSNLSFKTTEYKKSSNSSNITSNPSLNNTKTFSSSIIIDVNNDGNISAFNQSLSSTFNPSKSKSNSFFVTTTTTKNNAQTIGGEENVYKDLNDGFSDILQRTEVLDKNDFNFHVKEPQQQLTSRNPKSIKKPSSRSPRTARTKRRTATNTMFSSTY